MALLEENPFAAKGVFPSWFANAVQRFLSTAAPSFQLTRLDATHVQVVAAAEDAAAVIAIKGKWRWNEATVSRAHPGGAAGTFDIFVTAANNKISGGGVDETNRAFGLRIVKTGETPTIEAGTVDIFRKVGELTWDGAAITGLTQLVGLPPGLGGLAGVWDFQHYSHLAAQNVVGALSPSPGPDAVTVTAPRDLATAVLQVSFRGMFKKTTGGVADPTEALVELVLNGTPVYDLGARGGELALAGMFGGNAPTVAGLFNSDPGAVGGIRVTLSGEGDYEDRFAGGAAQLQGGQLLVPIPGGMKRGDTQVVGLNYARINGAATITVGGRQLWVSLVGK